MCGYIIVVRVKHFYEDIIEKLSERGVLIRDIIKYADFMRTDVETQYW